MLHPGRLLPRLLSRVLLPVAVVACAIFPRLLLHSVLAERSIFILFALAVMVSARFGGFASGVIATALSLAAGIPLFLARATDPDLRLASVIEIILFTFAALGISWLAGHLRAERLRAETLVTQLESALAQVKTLRGLLPICADCKKIRDDEGRWHPLESYIRKHSHAEFSHGFCPECFRRRYAELADEPEE